MIYLDNAATSCPKPPEVVDAVTQALSDVCANPSRGAYELSLQASRNVMQTRRAVARLFNIRDESRVIFTLNATHALNIALKGLLAPEGIADRPARRPSGRSGAGRPRPSKGAGLSAVKRDGGGAAAHVVISSIEHNSVARPLAAMAKSGVEVTRVPCSGDGTTDPDDVLAAVRPDTVLVVLTHASNVLGTVLPVAQVGPRLRDLGVPLLVDAAQTAGLIPIDVDAMGISLLAVSGHKGLLGPQGVGALYISAELELATLVEGGTGSRSESLEQPTACPDRFEAGTLNSPGIAGLGAGIAVVDRFGVEARGERERALAQRLRDRLVGVERVRLYGPARVSRPAVCARTGATSRECAAAGAAGASGLYTTAAAAAPTASTPTALADGPSSAAAVGIVSVAIDGLSSSQVAHVLDREFDIAVRAGLHCAPEAHRVAGTMDTGLVRLSVGHATTEAEVDAAAEALTEIAGKPARYWVTEWERHHAR